MIMAPASADVYSLLGYEKVCEFKALDNIVVEKYKCTTSGLTVVLAQVEGPIVNGYLCVPTEAHDDDGLPHTLEHLVFLGSEEYPYKGVLDLLSNRSLSSGTNAWTDTDHTAYTMTTAGAEGFLNLLPIYLDHVVFPLLKDSGFVTEVHHVTGEGEDAGVVYCEMQGRENTGEELVHLEFLRGMYPGHCGYKSQTGGLMLNLRTSTTNEKIRAYHNAYYRPENLQVIVSGQVTAKDLLEAIKPFQNKLKDHVSKWSDNFERPWQLPVPPLESDVMKTVEYPSDSEDAGMVFIGWRGPSGVTEIYNLLAMTLLMEYLTDSSVSLLQREFVEIDDPYCSSVSYSCIENSVSCFFLLFVNAPKNKLKLIPTEATRVLESLSSGESSFDMDRIASVVHRRKLEVLRNIETNPRDYFAFQLISDCLYGDTNDQLYQRLNQLEDIEKLKKEPSEFWMDLLNQYLVGKPTVTIVGEPSKKKMEAMMKEEEERVEEQKKTLGAEKLKELGLALEDAIRENGIEPPKEMLECVNIPDPAKINFHPISPYCNYECKFSSAVRKQGSSVNLDEVPFRIEVDDVNSRFVSLYAILKVKDVDSKLRMYLPLLVQLLLESPIERDGKIVPYDEVVTQLNADTESSNVCLGLGGGTFTAGSFAETLQLYLNVETSKYERGVKWLKEILYHTKFTAERMKVIANKMINKVAERRRNGHKMTDVLLKEILYKKCTNQRVVNPFRQLKFLTKVVTMLSSEKDSQQVIADMEALRSHITRPENLVIHMATKVSTLEHPLNIWKQEFTNKNSSAVEPPEFVSDKLCITEDSDCPRHCILGLGSVETSFLIQTVPCIDSYHDPELPALMVLIQYITQLESFTWKQIRGMGYAYDVWMTVKPGDGLLYFSLYRCTNLPAAYKEARNIVKQCKDMKEWDRQLLESAKSSLIFEIIEREKDVANVVTQSLLSYLRQTEHTYNKDFLSKISAVTAEDLSKVCHKYLEMLLDPQQCRTAVVCYTAKVKEHLDAFKGFGIELSSIENIDESFMAE